MIKIKVGKIIKIIFKIIALVLVLSVLAVVLYACVGIIKEGYYASYNPHIENIFDEMYIVLRDEPDYIDSNVESWSYILRSNFDSLDLKINEIRNEYKVSLDKLKSNGEVEILDSNERCWVTMESSDRSLTFSFRQNKIIREKNKEVKTESTFVDVTYYCKEKTLNYEIDYFYNPEYSNGWDEENMEMLDLILNSILNDYIDTMGSGAGFSIDYFGNYTVIGKDSPYIDEMSR